MLGHSLQISLFQGESIKYIPVPELRPQESVLLTTLLSERIKKRPASERCFFFNFLNELQNRVYLN